jgi:hypothetical protein
MPVDCIFEGSQFLNDSRHGCLEVTTATKLTKTRTMGREWILKSNSFTPGLGDSELRSLHMRSFGVIYTGMDPA